MSHHDLLNRGLLRIVVCPADIGICSAHTHEENTVVKPFKLFQGGRSSGCQRDRIDIAPDLVNASNDPGLERKVAMLDACVTMRKVSRWTAVVPESDAPIPWKSGLHPDRPCLAGKKLESFFHHKFYIRTIIRGEAPPGGQQHSSLRTRRASPSCTWAGFKRMFNCSRIIKNCISYSRAKRANRTKITDNLQRTSELFDCLHKFSAAALERGITMAELRAPKMDTKSR